MAGFLDFVRTPFRSVSRLAIDALEWTTARLRNLQYASKNDFRGRTIDYTQIIPRIPDVYSGALGDTDPVLEEAGDAGYDLIYGDHSIVTHMDDLCLTVAASDFTFYSEDEDSKKLIPALARLALNPPKWASLVSDLPHALVQGVRIAALVMEAIYNQGKDRWEVRPKDFIVKNKARFAPLRPDWSRMAMVDDGNLMEMNAINVRSGFAKELPRDHFIVGVWRDREDRLGWGAGLGPILYKLAYIRDRLIHILCRSVEMHGGGVRYALLSENPDTYKGQSADDDSAVKGSVLDSLRYMNSFDASVFPAFVKDVRVAFPTPGSIEAVQGAITNYFEHAVAKLITGTTVVSSNTQGTAGATRVLAETERIRKQYVLNWVCEVLQKDYVELLAACNPWIFREAGVGFDTRLPRLVGTVPGGHNRLEEAQIVAQMKVPVLLTDIYRRTGFRQPTAEQIENGEVYDPTAMEKQQMEFDQQVAGTKGDLGDGGRPVNQKHADRNKAGNAAKSKKQAAGEPVATP